jgi:hypothetical protein
VGGAFVLMTKVKQQWYAHLEFPALHMLVNEMNTDDGYSTNLHWRRERHTKFSYIWQFTLHTSCIVASSSQIDSVLSYGGNIVTNKRYNFTPEMVNVLVTLKENKTKVDWSIVEDVEEVVPYALLNSRSPNRARAHTHRHARAL